MGHLQAFDMVVIAAYCGLMLYVGWWSSRKQESTEEYFVGSRGISPIVAGISIIATVVSSISYLAGPGEMVKNGPGWMWQMLHAPISFIVVGYFVIPHIMKHPVTSAYELLGEKFGTGVQRMTSGLFVLSRIFWMGLVIYSCSLAVSTVSGLPLHFVLISIGVIGTIYTIMGGIRAVMITDVIQFCVLIGGAGLSVLYVAWRCGGLTAWWPDWSSPAVLDLNWPEPEFFTLDPAARLSVVSVLIYGCSYWIMTATGDQVVIQRFLSTRDARDARRSFGLSILGDALTSGVLFLTGMAMVGYYLHFPEELPDTAAGLTAQADKLFPEFIGAALPAGLTGLVVSAIFAAAMSSLDSGINSISTVMITDFRAIVARDCATDAQRLRRARNIGVAVGVIAIAMSFAVSFVPGSNLLEKTVRVSSLLAAPMFVTFALAFFARRATPAGAWTGIVTGAGLGFTLTFWNDIVRFLTGADSHISITFIMPLSALGAWCAGVVVSRFTPERD